MNLDDDPLSGSTELQPYAGLTPDTVTDALCSLGLPADGRLLALNSYENRVYQAGLEDQLPVVVKFYRPQRWSNAAIVEEHSFTEQLAQEQIPVLAPTVINAQTLHTFEGFRFAVFRRQGGRAPELESPDVLQWLGRLMGRIHAQGQLRRFEHRPTLNPQTFGIDARDYLLAHSFIPKDIRPAWESVVTMALGEVTRCYERAGEPDILRLHGDCHAGNILWTDAGPHFVDFDDARNGPAIQDLWMLLSGERHEMTLQLSEILEGYEQFCDFQYRELHLLEALRTLRLLHYSSWLAQRWHDPAFPAAFPWFNTQRYWEDRVLELKEQVALMQESPLSLR
jgi:Ser/Thr protein kinase RdoA (MazF antagonist)